MQFSHISFVLLYLGSVHSQNVSDFMRTVVSYKNCFSKKLPALCLKERALRILNETIMDDRPITIGFLEIQKNPDYYSNDTDEENLPEEATQRSLKLSDVLMEKIEEFFKSRTVKLNLSNAFEGRGKGGGGGGGGKKGGMTMMAMAGMAAMMANMVMGKMALMAGSALMIAKISLLLSIIMIVKKMQEKGGGEEKHIVYADSGHGGGGGGGYGGGGGWHRSLDDGHNIVYKGHWGPSPATENGSGL